MSVCAYSCVYCVLSHMQRLSVRCMGSNLTVLFATCTRLTHLTLDITAPHKWQLPADLVLPSLQNLTLLLYHGGNQHSANAIALSVALNLVPRAANLKHVSLTLRLDNPSQALYVDLVRLLDARNVQKLSCCWLAPPLLQVATRTLHVVHVKAGRFGEDEIFLR